MGSTMMQLQCHHCCIFVGGLLVMTLRLKQKTHKYTGSEPKSCFVAKLELLLQKEAVAFKRLS